MDNAHINSDIIILPMVKGQLMSPRLVYDPKNSLLHHLFLAALAAAAAAVLLQPVLASSATAAAPPSSVLPLPARKGCLKC